MKFAADMPRLAASAENIIAVKIAGKATARGQPHTNGEVLTREPCPGAVAERSLTPRDVVGRPLQATSPKGLGGKRAQVLGGTDGQQRFSLPLPVFSPEPKSDKDYVGHKKREHQEVDGHHESPPPVTVCVIARTLVRRRPNSFTDSVIETSPPFPRLGSRNSRR